MSYQRDRRMDWLYTYIRTDKGEDHVCPVCLCKGSSKQFNATVVIDKATLTRFCLLERFVMT